MRKNVYFKSPWKSLQFPAVLRVHAKLGALESHSQTLDAVAWNVKRADNVQERADYMQEMDSVPGRYTDEAFANHS